MYVMFLLCSMQETALRKELMNKGRGLEQIQVTIQGSIDFITELESIKQNY